MSIIILSLTCTVCTFATKFDPLTVKSPVTVALPLMVVFELVKLICVSAAIFIAEPVPIEVNAIERFVPTVFICIPPFDDDIIMVPFVALISIPTSDITWVWPVPFVDIAKVWLESALILIVVSDVPKNGVSPI